MDICKKKHVLTIFHYIKLEKYKFLKIPEAVSKHLFAFTSKDLSKKIILKNT